MFSMIKSQIIKPFLQFTKNLSADQINVSLLKGEARLQSLELNETVLMELLGLPTWIGLRKARCSDLSFKIHWTKLETVPVCVMIDQVEVEVEALNEPRELVESIVASYRTGSGKYGRADKVVDGASVLINSVSIRFGAPAFEASIEISRLTVMSKTPNWSNGTLDLTTLSLPSADAVLIFKQISWESIRIVANGLLTEFNEIPLKLITNSGWVRVKLKKRLSDSALICSRVEFSMADLLWVLTVSQVEAVIIFLRSLQPAVMLASEQRRQRASTRATEEHTIRNKTPPIPSSRGNRSVKQRNRYTAVSRIFRDYDILETSYHLSVHRAEFHFCDETKSDTDHISSPNGYVRVQVDGGELDWYPYHMEIHPAIRWHACNDFIEARQKWLNELHPANNSKQSIKVDCNDTVIMNSSVQSVIVGRLSDFTVSQVTFADSNSPAKSAARSHTVGHELPEDSHLFIASDRKFHGLSSKINILTVELRYTYTRSQSSLTTNNNSNPMLSSATVPCEDPPLICFGKVNPLYVRFDADTAIWFNTFVSTLQMNLARRLVALMRSSAVASTGENETVNAKRSLVRCNLVSPRVLLPLTPNPQSGSEDFTFPGPDFLSINITQLTIELLTPPLATHTASMLHHVIWHQPDTECIVNNEQSVPTPNMSKFQKLLNATEPDPINWFQHWRVHCSNAYAQFLTYTSIYNLPSSGTAALKHPKPTLYRQTLLDPIVLTLWATLNPNPQADEPLLEVLLNLDSALNPSVQQNSNPNLLQNHPHPIRLHLGHKPNLTSNSIQIPSYSNRFPDTVDHILSLTGLSNHVSNVLHQIGLDTLQINGDQISSPDSQQRSGNRFLNLAFQLQSAVELHIVSLDCPDSSQITPTSICQLDPISNHTVDPCEIIQSSLNPNQLNLPPNGFLDMPRSLSRSIHSAPKRCGNLEESHSQISLDTMDRPPDSRSLSFNKLSTVDQTQYDNQIGQTNNFGPLLFSPSSDSMLNRSDRSGSMTELDSPIDWMNAYHPLIKPDDTDSLISVSTSDLHSESMYSSTSSLMCNRYRKSSSFNQREEVSMDATCLLPSSCDETQCIYPSHSTSCRTTLHEASLVIPSVKIAISGLGAAIAMANYEFHSRVNVQAVHVDFSETSFKFDNFHLNSPTTEQIWVIVLSSKKEPIDPDNPFQSWRSSYDVRVDLIQEWSVALTESVGRILSQILSKLSERVDSGQLQSLLDRQSMLCRSKMEVVIFDLLLNLSGGSAVVNLTTDVEKETKPSKTLHLNKGLSVHLDRNSVIHIGQHVSSVFHPIPDSEPLAGHATLLRHYATENRRLRDEVEKLKNEVANLRLEIDRLRLN